MNYVIIVFLIPFKYASSSSSVLIYYLIINAGQLPSTLFMAVGVESERFGRRRTIFAMLVINCVCLVICSAVDCVEVFLPFATLGLLFNIGAVVTLFPYSGECYETKIRGTGVAINV
jgi:MFS family permease